MEQNKFYTLPKMPYGYKELEPYISEEQLLTHHQKHHISYVNGANRILEEMERAREEGIDLDMGAKLKELSFYIGGHILHSLFWNNMAPNNKGGGGEPTGELLQFITKEFGNFDRFKKEFVSSTLGIEGSGWSALTYDKNTDRLMIMQIEKHNFNIYPTFNILMVFDFWEHAYYIDYKSEKSKFIDAFWNIINWTEVNKRLNESKK